MTANPPPLLDRAIIDDLFDSIGAEGARSIIELFIAESGDYLMLIAAAADGPGDPARCERARRAAHAFRSGAGQVGAAAAAAAAFAVERAAAENSPELPRTIAMLQECAAATIKLLPDFRK
jgi:HPt (histidine-containing phosphotransfer) domain-containing protein